ncbi:hypothetical protein ACJX0J_038815, partial [Zea mays]
MKRQSKRPTASRDSPETGTGTVQRSCCLRDLLVFCVLLASVTEYLWSILLVCFSHFMMSVALHLPAFHFPIWFATHVLRSSSKSERRYVLNRTRVYIIIAVDKQLALAESLTARKTEPDELGEKKRRLAPDQVRALERCFEADNRLDPDRKARVARDLALNPRQVAVWFQNRRARWKAKALHRDFAALRARHDALRRDKDALAAE